MFGKLSLYRKRGSACLVNQSKAVAYPKYMCVNSHFGFLEYYCLYDIGCLATHARKFFEFFACGGDFASKILN